VVLAGEFIESPWPHPGRQRLGFFEVGVVHVLEKVDGGSSLKWI
jgi:hypothetical protein